MNKFNNIAGGPFQPYVAEQIEARKEFLKESHAHRENKHILYQNNRNSWIRITSNTVVSPDHPLYLKYPQYGQNLAEKYILQGGVIETVKNDDAKYMVGGSNWDVNQVNRGGIGKNGLYNLLPNQPLGPKPMPGMTSISISSAGTLGSLQYGDIKFKCYDLEQLEIMDALYMKLGFSVIIEWGHTLYLDNNKQISKPSNLYIKGINDKEELIVEIQKKREEQCANFDAMLGTISNFSWVANPDGSYDCGIKVVGAGDILESLKINHSTLKIIDESQSQEDEDSSSQVSDKNLSNINTSIFNLSQYAIKRSRNKKINKVTIDDEEYRKVVNINFINKIYNFIFIDRNGGIVGDDNAIRGNHYSLLNGLSKTDDVPVINKEIFDITTVNYSINDNSAGIDPNGLQYQTYITLGHLLAIISSQGILYTNRKPYLYIDFHDTLNYCHTAPNQMFLDPQVCIIPNNYNKDVNTTKKNIYPKQNISKNNPKYDTSLGWSKDNITEFLGGYNKYLKTDNPEHRANLMYININTNHITNILKNIREGNSGDVFLFDFLNSLLEDISYSLGNTNKFRILVDDTSKSLRIIDDNRLNSLAELDNDYYTEIPIFGKESIVYNYKLESKISANMASMITISSQANPSLYTEDMFSLSNLSRGLMDRMMVDKKIVNDKEEEEEILIDPQSLKMVDQYFKDIYQGDNNKFYFNSTTYNSVSSIWRELLKNYQNNINSYYGGATIIPLNFSIELDGISGIIPNSSFIIPTNLLPSSYKTIKNKPKVSFIIHKIDQNFDNNKWTTKLVGQIMNIRFDEDDKFKKDEKYDKTPRPPALNEFSLNISQSKKLMQDMIYHNGTLPDNALRLIDNYDKFKGDINSDGGRIRLFNPASVSLDQLLEKSIKDGINIKINSAYRTLQDQMGVRLLNAPSSKKQDDNFIKTAPSTKFSPYTAIPGRSNHGFGLAVDFADDNFKKLAEGDKAYEWLKINGPEFGFKRIPSESWHWEYQLNS